MSDAVKQLICLHKAWEFYIYIFQKQVVKQPILLSKKWGKIFNLF